MQATTDPELERRWRLVMVLLVRDEADILEQLLRFHLTQGVDYFYVLDNASTDRTIEILEAFAALGVLEFRRIETTDFDQARWMSEATHHAIAKLGARWVIPSDADEFWISECGDLKRSLTAWETDEVDGWRVRRLNRIGKRSCPPASEFHPADFPFIAEGGHSTAGAPGARPWIQLPILDKVIVSTDRFQGLEMGNHGLTQSNAKVGDLTDVVIHHFPIRSWGHFSRKVRQGGEALARSAHKPSIGWHWRRWHQMQLDGRLQEEYEQQLYDQADRTMDSPNASIQQLVDPEQPVCRGAVMLDSDPDDHYGDEFYRMHEPWEDQYGVIADFLLAHLTFDSAIDFGCGNGFLLSRMEKAGKSVVGIEGSLAGVRSARRSLCGPVHRRDLRLPIHEGRFDLVVCTEVSEHLEAEFADTLLDNLVRAASSHLYFTAATPEQTGGLQHVNLQEHEYWFRKLELRGYRVDWDLTKSLREELERSVSRITWFTKNSTIFHRVA